MAIEFRRLFYEKLETGLAIAFMAYLPIVVINVMVYTANIYSSPGLAETLAVSSRTPWGILTSLFVHADEAHLFSNMISFFIFLMLMVGTNVFLSREEVKGRISSCFLAIFLIPIALNLALILLIPEINMIGSSGIIYSLEGSCFGFSLLNVLQFGKVPNRFKSEHRIALAFFILNLTVCVGFFFAILFFPELFLGTTHETIIWFHGLAFSGGTMAAILYPTWRKVK